MISSFFKYDRTDARASVALLLGINNIYRRPIFSFIYVTLILCICIHKTPLFLAILDFIIDNNFVLAALTQK